MVLALLTWLGQGKSLPLLSGSKIIAAPVRDGAKLRAGYYDHRPLLGGGVKLTAGGRERRNNWLLGTIF